jgi:polyhydroxyalkanoate synthesis regulator phasin
MSSWELSEGKYTQILIRIKALEEAYNNLAVAVDNLASQQQVQELLVILQADIKAFSEKVTALENRVTSIEQEPLS